MLLLIIFISSSANFVDMSNVINHTIYSSVENGTYKSKEAEPFVIKLYYPFIINCYRSQFTSMVKSKRSLKNTHKGRLTRNILSGSVLGPYCSPWYIISRRIWLSAQSNYATHQWLIQRERRPPFSTPPPPPQKKENPY